MPQTKPNNKRATLIKINIALALFSLAVTFTSFLHTTLSWFDFNRSAVADQGRVKIESNLKINYDLYINDSAAPLVDDDIFFNNLIPGQTHWKIKFVATNTGSDPLYLNLSFLAPLNSDEVPYVDTLGTYGPIDYYYYLGSQIKITAISTTVNALPYTTTTGAGNYLVTTSSSGVSKGQVNGIDSEITSFSSLNLVDDVLLAIGDVTVVELDFLFVDNGTNQNVYMEAWPLVGTSSRELSVNLIEAII